MGGKWIFSGPLNEDNVVVVRKILTHNWESWQAEPGSGEWQQESSERQQTM